MGIPRLYDLKHLANEWEVPLAALRRCAEQTGLLVSIGSALKIAEADLREFIILCQENPNRPASTSGNAPAETPSTSSSTAAGKSARAQEIATKLKSRSKNTSKPGTGRVVRLKREK